MGSLQQTLASLGGAAAAFTPNSVASIWAYYEADSYSQADGSQIVTDWQDLSANNRDATPSGAYVKFKTNAINTTLPSVEFNNGASGAYFTLPNMPALTAGAWFLVLKINNLGPSGGCLMGSSAEGDYFPLATGKIYSTFGTTDRKNLIDPSSIMTDWNVFHGHSATNDWDLSQNGASIFATGTNTVGFPATAYLGRNLDNTYWAAEAAGLYFFSAKLSAGDNTDMLAYISGKWGV